VDTISSLCHPSERRDRTHTIEVDYRALHVNILSIENGAGVIEGDPYDLTEGFLPGADRQEQRKYLKYLVLTSINAKDKTSAFRAFRDNYPKGDPGKSYTNRQLDVVLAEFLRREPQLEESLFADQGIRLMNVDSRLVEYVLGFFTIFRIPTLPIHDSFVIDYNHGALLKDKMTKAARAVLGQAIPLSHNYVGLDELEGDEHQDDYVQLRHLDRTPGYLERKRWFEERMENR